MFIPVFSERDYRAECLNGCICSMVFLWKNSVVKKQMEFRGNKKTTNNFLIAQRCGLLQYGKNCFGSQYSVCA